MSEDRRHCKDCGSEDIETSGPDHMPIYCRDCDSTDVFFPVIRQSPVQESRDAARQDRSDRMDEIFAGIWERDAMPDIRKSPTLLMFEPTLRDVAREWFRKGYSRGGMDGAAIMGRNLIQDFQENPPGLPID